MKLLHERRVIRAISHRPATSGRARLAVRFGRRGFTLIEMVAVMSLLAVLILIMAATLWATVKIERADSALLNRVTVQAELADAFRADVGRSRACPTTVGDVHASPQCVILQVADDQYIVYTWSKERLNRREIDGDTETARSLAIGGEHVTAEFVRPADDGRMVSLRLIESRGAGTSRRNWPVVISAALGGDWQ